MPTNQLTKSRIADFFERTPTSPMASTRVMAAWPRCSQTGSVRLFSKNMDLCQLRALLDLYDDEKD